MNIHKTRKHNRPGISVTQIDSPNNPPNFTKCILKKKQVINNDEATETNLPNNAVVVWDNIRTPPRPNILHHLHLEEASSICFVFFIQRNK